MSLPTLLLGVLCVACTPVGRTPLDAESLERARIQQLFADFASSASRHDWHGMSALFSEDAVWQASAGTLGFRHQGRGAIQRWLVGNQDKIEVMFYLTSPPAIELRGSDSARAHVSMTELLRLKPSGEVKQLFGVYNDELSKRDGRWYFSSRRFELRRSAGLGADAQL